MFFLFKWFNKNYLNDNIIKICFPSQLFDFFSLLCPFMTQLQDSGTLTSTRPMLNINKDFSGEIKSDVNKD